MLIDLLAIVINYLLDAWTYYKNGPWTCWQYLKTEYGNAKAHH